MTKGPDAFRTISEVAEELNVPQHVLRFWETRFSQIRPLKRSGGRRFYRPDDVALLRGIRYLLYGAGYTIRGVQRILKEQGIAHVQRIAPASGDELDAMPDIALADSSFADASTRDDDFGDVATGLDGTADDDAGFGDAMDDNPLAPNGADAFPMHQMHALAGYEAVAHAEVAARAAPDPAVIGDAKWRDTEVEAATWSDGPLPEAGTHSEATQAAISSVDPIINRYAPGPLSSRPDRLAAPRLEAADDRIIQPQYRLTTDTREHLQAVLDEIRECRRLLNSALSRLQD